MKRLICLISGFLLFSPILFAQGRSDSAKISTIAEKIAASVRSPESKVQSPKSKDMGSQAVSPVTRQSSVPLEVFVHGALCVAYSGQCLTSEALGGRSANRGECAQACRMPYELLRDGQLLPLGDRKYLLSPQDLAGLELLPDLARVGVTSLKIEGRLKTPEYVANITRIPRHDGFWVMFLPLRLVGAFGIAMIVLHNLLDRLHVEGWHGPNSPVPGYGAKLFIILHQPFEAFPIVGFPSPVVFVLYPLIPWVGVMAAGYAFGAVYQWNAQRRRSFLVRLGSGAIVLFVVLRAINHYADPSHWSRQETFAFTILSFLNTTKYPPSLAFLLMTLGPALLALAWFESNNVSVEIRLARPQSLIGKLRGAFVTFGRVPLFFYLLQWPTAHLISVIVHAAAGKPVAWMFSSPVDSPGPPPGVGFNLAVVYVCWLAGVLLLYPLCKWFAAVKARRRDWWLSYL